MTRESLQLDLTPDTSLFDDIGSGNLAVHEAVGEIVANSFDARLGAGGEQLRVDIKITDESISILDNAGGINRERIKKALRISDKRETRGADEKGMYGWGLKASASTIGYFVEITSRPVDGDYEIYVALPIRDLASGKLKWDDISAEINNSPSDDSPLGKSSHGTSIMISDLRQKGFNKGDLERHLRFTYAPHLKDGDQIFLDGVALEPWEPVVMSQMKHEFDKTFGEKDEYRIHGWIGIGKTQSSGEYGLNIYRKNQLIEAWNKDPFTSKHQMTSRVVGEVHADFVPTNFNKKGFEKDSPEWKSLVRVLRDEITPFLAASRRLGRDKGTDMEVKAAEAAETLAKQLSQVEGWSVAKTGNWVEKPESKEVGVNEEEKKSPISTEEFPRSFRIQDGETIEIALKVSSLGDANEHWSYVASKGQIMVVLNQDSPLLSKYSKDGLAIIEAFATAEAIQDYLVSRHNFGHQEAKRIRNEYLTRALGE